MILLKCDRCGKVDDAIRGDKFFNVKVGDSDSGILHLCSACRDSFYSEFLKRSWDDSELKFTPDN